MQLTDKKTITVQTIVNAPIDKVWKKWNNPNDIVKWNNASDDWHTTKAENDLRIGGKFLSRMEAKDGSMAFDFEGVYDAIKTNEHIEYTIADGRKVKISFTEQDGKTKVVETFDPEDENSIELQHDGWQSILDSFKKYTEEN
jgi:uncharacterized protein YndB with AHSA1/START domain